MIHRRVGYSDIQESWLDDIQESWLDDIQESWFY